MNAESAELALRREPAVVDELLVAGADMDPDRVPGAVAEAKRLLRETVALQQVLVDMKLHLEEETV